MKIVIILALFAIGTMGLPAPLGENDPTRMLTGPAQQPTPSVAESAGNLLGSLFAVPVKVFKGVMNPNQNQYPNMQYPNMPRNYPTDPFSSMFPGIGGMLSTPMSYLPSMPFFGSANQPTPTGRMALQNLLQAIQRGDVPAAQGMQAIQMAAQSGQISQRDVNQAQQIVAMSPQGQMNPMNQMNQNSMNQMNPMGQQDPIGQDPQLFLTNGP